MQPNLSDPQTILITQLIIGALLLIFGRKVFWLFLGGIGFLAGMTLANKFVGGESSTTLLIVGLIGGLLGAGIAIFIQKIAVAIAGFLGGGMLGYIGTHMIGWQPEHFPWIPVLVCGVLGIFFATFLFKWALTMLSSGVGAYMIVRAFTLPAFPSTLLIIGLAILGIIIQVRLDRKKKAGGGGNSAGAQ
jgi:hypothetical protein